MKKNSVIKLLKPLSYFKLKTKIQNLENLQKENKIKYNPRLKNCKSKEKKN